MTTAIRVLFAVVVAAIVAFCVWFGFTVWGDRSHPAHTSQVIVPRGSDFRQIADLLADRGIVANAFSFRVYAKLRHADTDVHAGEFSFPPHESAAEVLDRLRSGGAQVARWVTIPEGFTAKQIAQRLADEGFGNAATFAGYFLHHSVDVDGTRTATLEGVLFPSTYLIPIGATPQSVAAMMTAQFQRELPADARVQARRLHLTVPQVVTLASLIEREAKADDERALMAGVYYNRLRIGMPLEVDATIEYALPRHADVITYRDLKIDSPYNSYLHAGLPPTPIANPGEPSLVAAFNPRPSNYLYYVYKGDGHHAFSTTLAQQNANIARYLK